MVNSAELLLRKYVIIASTSGFFSQHYDEKGVGSETTLNERKHFVISAPMRS